MPQLDLPVSVSMFRLLHANSVVELYALAEPRRCTVDCPLVVVALGNATDFASGVTNWYESPAWGADFIICVRSTELNQAEYVMAPGDGMSDRDWTDSDVLHTQRVMGGVVETLKGEAADRCSWVLCGLSGGCVTAVAVARELSNVEDKVIGIVVDSGVPGSGQAWELRRVPVAVYRYTRPSDQEGRAEFWHNGNIAVEWKRRGYTVVEDEAYTFPGHASHMCFSLLGQCVSWFAWRDALSGHVM